MKQSQVLKTGELKNILALAAEQKTAAVMTYESTGKWRTTDVKIAAITETTINIDTSVASTQETEMIQEDLPVGMSFEQDHNRYIFETIVTGLEPSLKQTCTGKIILQMPEKVEKMERRAYTRVNVPDSLNVKVLFWHRGYTDDSPELPPEHYWQGNLINLSAGGVQITIDLEQGYNFRLDQFVGLQFTPLPYQKPIILEGYIKHLEKTDHGRTLILGVQTLGLEANAQGRQTIHRIVDVVSEYQKLNAAQSEQPSASTIKSCRAF